MASTVACRDNRVRSLDSLIGRNMRSPKRHFGPEPELPFVLARAVRRPNSQLGGANTLGLHASRTRMGLTASRAHPEHNHVSR